MPPFCKKHQRYHIKREDQKLGQSFTHCPECEIVLLLSVLREET